MEQSSINVIIGGLIAVIGAIVGASVNAFSNYKNSQIQAQREQQKLHLAKLEELFELIVDYNRATYWFLAKVAEYSINEPNAEQLNSMTEILTSKISRTITMVSFYAPEIEDGLKITNNFLMDLQNAGLFAVDQKLGVTDDVKEKRLIVSGAVNSVLDDLKVIAAQTTGIKKIEKK